MALDAIPCQFCSGEMEATVVEAFEGEHPDVIIVEGQGALSHPAYLTSTFILRGSQPHAVILQHAPGPPVAGRLRRRARCRPPPSEINLIETFADTKVIGLTINHENMTDAEVTAAIKLYELELGIPVTDALTRPPTGWSTWCCWRSPSSRSVRHERARKFAAPTRRAALVDRLPDLRAQFVSADHRRVVCDLEGFGERRTGWPAGR